MRRRELDKTFDLGDCVRLHSLQSARHQNGRLAFLVEFVSHFGRWKVELADGKEFVNVKPANMSPASIPESDDDDDEQDEQDEASFCAFCALN